METQDTIREFIAKQNPLQQTPFPERPTFPGALRALSVDELANSTGVNLLLSEIYRLDNEATEQRFAAIKFHETDKENAVLKEKLRASIATHDAQRTLGAMGFFLLGLAPSLWNINSTNHLYGFLSIITGTILLFKSGMSFKNK